MVKFAAKQTEDLKMYKLPEGVDYSYKAGVPGLYNEKGELVKKAEDMSAQELSTYEADYRRRRGEAQIKADQQVNAILKAEQEAKRKAAAEAKAKAEAEAKARAEAEAKAKPEAAKPEAKPEAAKPEATKVEPKPEATKVEPKPSLSQQYATARAAKDYETADRLGKEIWARRYSGKFTVPSVEKDGPRVNVATTQQQRMFDAIKANPDKPDPAVFKRAQRIGKTMEAYDVVLDYLLSEGHADTLEEAHYVMMQLDSEYIQDVIQERAWWDPAGLFTKTDREKALEKPALGYNPKKGTTGRLDKQQVIVAPLTTGGVTRYVTQKPGDPTKDPSIVASRANANPAWIPHIERLRAAAPDVISKSTQVAQGQRQLAKDVADAEAQASKLPPEYAARETLAPPPIIAPKPKPKPAPVVAAKPAPAPKLTKLQQDILDLRQMRANSLNRQGNVGAAQKLQTQVDVARASKKIPRINEKFPDVKGTLNPWESPTTGKSGVKYVTDPKTGKPVQITNPLYRGV